MTSERMREWRSKKKDKRMGVNHRHWRKRTGRDVTEERLKERNREYQKRYRMKTKNAIPLPGPSGDCSSFNNRMTKSRAVNKFKGALPKTPNKRTELLAHYVLKSKSPATKASLVCIETHMNCAGDSLMQDLNEIIKSTKHKRNKNALTVKNIATACVNGEAINKNKVKVKLADRLGISRKTLSSSALSQRIRHQVLHSEQASWEFTARKTRSDATHEDVRKKAYDYWLLPSNSRPTGNKSDIKRMRISAKVYSSHMIHILERTQTQVYNAFKMDHPEIKMGQRLFESCKPYFIRQTRQKDRNTCCCRYHTETKSAFKRAMDFRRNVLEQQDIDFQVFEHLDDIVSATLCESKRRQCLERKCEHCGVHTLQLLTQEKDKTDSAPDIMWEKYEYKEVNVRGKVLRKKLVLTKQTTKPGYLFDYLLGCIATFALHQYNASWQNDQFKALKENLPMNEAICVHDYSENYRCGESKELQADYFQKNEITLHVSIIHRHAILNYDGKESTEESPVVVTEQFFVISDDMNHDQHFSFEVQRQVATYLKSISCDISTMHEFTDGCAQQYKSRHCFGMLSNDTLGYNTLIRNYFETSHAKGPQDAAGGFVKQQADLAVTRGKASIHNARDLYEFTDDNLRNVVKDDQCKRRIFVLADEIPRPHSLYQPVSDTRSIHQLISRGDGHLLSRKLSCYSCDSCFLGDYMTCNNIDNTSEFRNIKMQSERGQASGDENEHEDDDTLIRIQQLKDTVTAGDIIAVLADDETQPYYMLRTKGQAELLLQSETDYYGASFKCGANVIRGTYFDCGKKRREFKLLNKEAIVPATSVAYICTNVFFQKKGNAKIIQLPEQQHQEIISNLEFMS